MYYIQIIAIRDATIQTVFFAVCTTVIKLACMQFITYTTATRLKNK